MEDTIRIAVMCDTAEKRIEGLQFRRIAPDECCVLAYPSARIVSLWGRNTPQNLEVAFARDGVVVDRAAIASMDETPVSSSVPADTAVEALVGIPVGAHIRVSGDRLVVDA